MVQLECPTVLLPQLLVEAIAGDWLVEEGKMWVKQLHQSCLLPWLHINDSTHLSGTLHPQPKGDEQGCSAGLM